MAKIFGIDEILRTFLRFCEKPTLARLARTSKLFSDPALDVLWENLESFSHLLKLFPEELISWQPSEKSPPKPSVNHLIVPRDWARVTPYARRIRSWVSEDLSYIDEPVVDHIAFGRLPEYILPRLTHVEVTATSVSGVHLQTFLLCPALESVTVWNTDPDPWATRAMNTFFRTLADRAPNLRKLIVHWGDNGVTQAPFIEGLADIFSQQRSNLHTVNLWSPLCVDANSFRHLSQLPCLTTLHLNLIGVEDAYKLCPDVKDRAAVFPALTNVFFAGAVEEFHKVLRFLGKSPQLSSLGFSVREYPRAKALIQLFHVVAARFPSLRILQFNVPKEEIDSHIANRLYNANPDLYHLDINILSPLIGLHCLAAVHLELGIPLQLNDVDLGVIAQAWPRLEILNLSCDPYCHPAHEFVPSTTIAGLLSIASRCTSLKHLGLFVDFTSNLSDEVVAGTEVVSPSVINLDVGRSWLLDPPLVAGLLSGIFPALKVFQWAGMVMPEDWEDHYARDFEYAIGWRQVFNYLPVFRAVRANERRARNSDGVESIMNVD